MNYESLAVESEVILPEQYWSRPAPAPAGELKLLWNVLMDGIRCYQEAVWSGMTRSADFREVERWVKSSDAGEITSFESLCELFSVNPTQARRRLFRLREECRRSDFAPIV